MEVIIETKVENPQPPKEQGQTQIILKTIGSGPQTKRVSSKKKEFLLGIASNLA